MVDVLYGLPSIDVPQLFWLSLINCRYSTGFLQYCKKYFGLFKRLCWLKVLWHQALGSFIPDFCQAKYGVSEVKKIKILYDLPYQSLNSFITRG